MRTLNSKVLFGGLQLADLITTLACFHYGLTEMNPVNVRLIAVFGLVGGLIVSKGLACMVVIPVKKSVWIGNVAYIAIVAWNSFLAVVGALATLAKA